MQINFKLSNSGNYQRAEVKLYSILLYTIQAIKVILLKIMQTILQEKLPKHLLITLLMKTQCGNLC